MQYLKHRGGYPGDLFPVEEKEHALVLVGHYVDVVVLCEQRQERPQPALDAAHLEVVRDPKKHRFAHGYPF